MHTLRSPKWLFFQAFAIALARSSHADPPPPHREHVRFSYSAPGDCPSREDFVGRVRDRSAELIDDPQAARSLDVTIENSGTWHGELRTEGIASGRGTRSIDGDSCESVVKSLAIFTAMALREGSPDELPPARPELMKEDASDPNEGFMPMAPPPSNVIPLLPDLHRSRFAFTVENSLGVMNDGGRTFGTGLGVDYFVASWAALGVEGAFMLDLPPDKSDGDANEARARFLAHVEFLTAQAKGSMFGPHRGRSFDQFIDIGGGAVFTRPRPAGRPAQDFPYSPEFLFSFGTGFRFFVDEEIAFSLHLDLEAYNQPNIAQRVYDPGEPFELGDSTLAIGPIFQIGFTWFPTRDRKWESP